MKKILFLSILTIVSCNRNNPVRPPVGGVLDKHDLETSRDRSKNLNLLERKQIQDWVNSQKIAYYPTQLNYWTNVDGFDKRERRQNEDLVTYSYDLYDFDENKIYDQPFTRENARFGHFEEIIAVENALRLMKSGEEVTLLVPSSLAYGTYGDQKKIDNDIPLIIKLKVL